MKRLAYLIFLLSTLNSMSFLRASDAVFSSEDVYESEDDSRVLSTAVKHATEDEFDSFLTEFYQYHALCKELYQADTVDQAMNMRLGYDPILPYDFNPEFFKEEFNRIAGQCDAVEALITKALSGKKKKKNLKQAQLTFNEEVKPFFAKNRIQWIHACSFKAREELEQLSEKIDEIDRELAELNEKKQRVTKMLDASSRVSLSFALWSAVAKKCLRSKRDPMTGNKLLRKLKRNGILINAAIGEKRPLDQRRKYLSDFIASQSKHLAALQALA